MPKTTDARYYPPDAMPLIYCDACIDVVLRKSEQAKKLFDKIIEAFNSPEVREATHKMRDVAPSDQEALRIIQGVITKEIAGANSADQKWLPDKQFVKVLFEKLAFRNLFVRLKLSHVNRKMMKSLGFGDLVKLTEEFVKIGFNNAARRAKGEYKIKPRKPSPDLLIAIIFKAVMRHLGIKEDQGGDKRGFKINGIFHDMTGLLSLDMVGSRNRRKVTQYFKDAGYELKHDAKIEQVAERWYMCRVVYSSLKEYCDKAAEDGNVLDPANVSREIEECDLAMGYPRNKRKTIQLNSNTVS